MRTLLILSMTVFTMIGLLSCGDNTINNTKDIEFPDSNVSFQQHVQPFMKFTCAYRGCHSEESREAGFSLETHFSMMSAKSGAMVRPHDPDGSLLIQTIEKYPSNCPFNYVWLPKVEENHIQGLRTWIAEGAKNN